MLDIRSLSLQYAGHRGPVEALSNLSLTVPDARFVALVGPSGCGKSTLLRCIAGLLSPTSGTILLDNQTMTGPDQRVGMVFQDPCLFPWLTVEQNISLGPRMQGWPRARQAAIVDRYLRETGLTDFRRSLPSALSGGMKQRASIARTLANDPRVVLMDEPFAALDSFTRSSMQEFLLSLWEHGKKTILFVTHDVEEAVFLADEVVILTPRPMRAFSTIAVPFARLRAHSLKQSAPFFAMRNTVLDTLEQAMAR